jgi:hypothetical protein
MNRLFFAQSRAGHRLAAALLVALLLIALAGAGLVLAQGGTPRALRVGQTVTGTLDARNFSQSYTFDARAGNTVTIAASTATRGLSLALTVTDTAGETLARASDLTRTEVTIRDFKIPADGTYFITVLRATGAQGAAQGEFSLSLTGDVATAPATVTLAQGMSISLTWSTNDDMNLEVRDPVGGAVNFRTPSVPSGGRLSSNVNGGCTNTTGDNPTETISWPGGDVPGGSYEIIVYFNQACGITTAGREPQFKLAQTPAATEEATESAVRPQSTTEATLVPTSVPTVQPEQPSPVAPAAPAGSLNFVVTITVDGRVLEPIRGTLAADQQYVTSFILAGADQVTVQPGGPNLDINLTPAAAKIAAPTALGTRTTVNGTISHDNPFDAWSLQVAANARPVTIQMNAVGGGSLDPFLVLLGPDGNIIASNDDANANTRNAEIANQVLTAGRYTILATRFALAIGGTEGSYTLQIRTGTGTVTSATVTPTTAAAAATATTNLPTGPIQVTLIWNTRADLRLLIRDPNGRSVFSDNRTPDNSGILERLGNFRCENVTNTPLTYAYWPTNPPVGTYEVGVWQESRCSDPTIQPTYTLTVTVRGNEVIRVTDRPDPNKLHFLTTFTIDASGNATAGQGGIVQKAFNGQNIAAQLPNAPVLEFGTPVNGTIAPEAPFVIYQFEGKTGQKIRIEMKNTGGNLDPQLFLLDANGVQKAENDDLEPGKDSNSRIDFTITTDGSYVVVATRYGVEFGGTTGNYQLTLAQTNQ